MKEIDFRKIIRNGLKEKKMSIPKLAHQVGLNQQTIYNYLAQYFFCTSNFGDRPLKMDLEKGRLV